MPHQDEPEREPLCLSTEQQAMEQESKRKQREFFSSLCKKAEPQKEPRDE